MWQPGILSLITGFGTNQRRHPPYLRLTPAWTARSAPCASDPASAPSPPGWKAAPVETGWTSSLPTGPGISAQSRSGPGRDDSTSTGFAPPVRTSESLPSGPRPSRTSHLFGTPAARSLPARRFGPYRPPAGPRQSCLPAFPWSPKWLSRAGPRPPAAGGPVPHRLCHQIRRDGQFQRTDEGTAECFRSFREGDLNPMTGPPARGLGGPCWTCKLSQNKLSAPNRHPRESLSSTQSWAGNHSPSAMEDQKPGPNRRWQSLTPLVVSLSNHPPFPAGRTAGYKAQPCNALGSVVGILR